LRREGEKLETSQSAEFVVSFAGLSVGGVKGESCGIVAR
jgi:hypothetical protein